MKKIVSILVVNISLFLSSGSYALTFGIFPQYQPLKLAELNAPLINYLNKSLSEPVYFRTTDNFANFKKKTERQYYDIVMIAPNLGYQLSVSNLYKPVLHLAYRPQAVFIVPDKSPIKHLHNLKGKKIAFPPELAITTKVAYKKLKEIGLPKNSYEANNRKSHLESFRWLAIERSDAAALTRAVWEARPVKEKEGYRVLGYSETVPGIFILVKDKKWFEPVKKALLKFENTPEGQSYFKKTKLVGYEPITEKTFTEISELYQ
ncbi:phosphate/phosphite/phosphonate ABC transporter substrate-binding protein [Thiomicrorhabdus lithotrophica]|uniref:Phosphate/phosphite/phosphonate ABC transporter substrate-binding protein n=1 Tax=Thiomicrorhabdus lithotrophica TaxID=2949997 RepID=A0ABY8CAX9_9GAMM|nr:PhnD/SsuA/transferrin family substrate-binding protein [Thiomicrorhabdus lithotrophica]WEJ62387.1 phosphate/phosphite/phosphonate ABC transporter substrate-binding protein [Thiomicrorhabdus lithotrophica]